MRNPRWQRPRGFFVLAMMNTRPIVQEKDEARLAPDILRLLVESQGRRISSAEIGGRKVWIKRYDAERLPIAKWLHGRANAALKPWPYLKSSLILPAAGMALREQRKHAAFRAAGFRVPDILFANDRAMITVDIGMSLDDTLRSGGRDGARHDGLLVDAAASLGSLHAAGLCHGRPHLRDCYLAQGTIGYIDFEEEPEAVMPLAHAQGRDAWLAFFHVVTRAMDASTPSTALEAYRDAAPAETVAALGDLVGAFSRISPLLSLASKVHDGGDLRRLRAATGFFQAALGRQDPLQETPS